VIKLLRVQRVGRVEEGVEDYGHTRDAGVTLWLTALGTHPCPLAHPHAHEQRPKLAS
jgi:hypothetical protein